MVSYREVLLKHVDKERFQLRSVAVIIRAGPVRVTPLTEAIVYYKHEV